MLFGSWIWPCGHLSQVYPNPPLLLRQLQLANGLGIHWVFYLFGWNCGHPQSSHLPQLLVSIESWIWYWPVHVGLTHCFWLVKLWTVPAGHGSQVYPSAEFFSLQSQIASGLAMHWVLVKSGMNAGHLQVSHLPQVFESIGCWICLAPLHVLLIHLPMLVGSWTCPNGHCSHE